MQLDQSFDQDLQLTSSLVAVSNSCEFFSNLFVTDKLKTTAGMLTVMSYLGFNHHYAYLPNGTKYRITKSTVLDLLLLSKSKISIVKELIRRMVVQAGPEYLFCHSAAEYDRKKIENYQRTHKLRICMCYTDITFINPKSICCANGLKSARGNESGL